MANEQREQLTQLLTNWELFKAANDAALAEAKSLGLQANTVGAEHKEVLERINTRLFEIEDLMTKTQIRLNRPGQGAVETLRGDKTPEEKAFGRACRRGTEGLTPDEQKLVLCPPEMKLLSVGDDTAGGYIQIPPTYATEILRTLIQFSPIRELATVIPLTGVDTWVQPKEGVTRFIASRVAETLTRTETTSATFADVTLRAYPSYAYPYATNQMLLTAGYNFEGWLMERLAMAFSVMEGAELINGDGVGKMEGLLSAGRITELAALPYGSQIVNSGDNATLTGDGCIAMVTALPEFYALNATWIAKRQTLGTMRSLKDGLGQYLWQPGLMLGQPNNFIGRPWREAIDMPAIALNAYPLIFGDIKRAVTIVDRAGMTILRNPYLVPGRVGFFTEKYSGGAPVLAEAYSVQKISA